MKKIKLILMALLFATLSACGGGNEGYGNNGNAGAGGGGGDGDTGGGGGGNQFDSTGLSVTLVLTDQAGNPTTAITQASPGILRATVTNNAGPVANKVVTFTTTLGKLDPESGTALTDANGLAIIYLRHNAINGAGTAKAEVSTNNETASDETSFEASGTILNNNLTVSLNLFDATTGQPTKSVSTTSDGKLQATVTDAMGPVADKVVTFTTTIGKLDPASGTALTDINGIASILLKHGGLNGAGVAKATITSGQGSASGETTFQTTGTIVDTTIDIGNGTGAGFTPHVVDLGGVTNLSAGGSLTATVNIVETSNDNAPYTPQASVEFTSICTQAGTATLDSPVLTINGQASSTYTAKGCSITDTITARTNIGGTIYTATANVTVEPPVAGSIQFISASESVIAIQGTGGAGLSETSEVIFKVLDEAGDPVANKNVNFNLSTTVGGITMSTDTATSNASGLVSTIVKSGTINTAVRVTATVVGTSISNQSVALAVSTGVPDNNSFDIAAATLNPPVWECNGGVVPITAYVADHFNNPAPDGTTVAFTTEGGIIDGSCNTVKGQCSVNWVSDEPRPDLDGRVTILATAIGEEGFVDTNSNGRYDSGEPFTDLPEAWRDDDEDGFLNGEEYVDFNTNGQYDGIDTTYNGVLCNSGCNPDGTLVNVRSSLVLVMASIEQDIKLYEPPLPTEINTIFLPDNGEVRKFRVDVQDARDQRPPAGTKISITTTNGKVEGGNSTEILNSNLAGPAQMVFSMKADATPSQGVATITVDVPGTHCQGRVIKYFNITVDDSLDVTPPTVKNTTPAPGATGVAVNSAIIIEFSEQMIKSTVEHTSITLVPTGSGAPLLMTRYYDSTTKKLFLYPNADLAASTLHSVTIPTSVADIAGNTLTEAYTLTFKTAP